MPELSLEPNSNHENTPKTLVDLFYDGANVVVSSIKEEDLQPELTNNIAKSYTTIVLRTDPANGEKTYYYLDFRRGVANTETGKCDTELSVVPLTGNLARRAYTIDPNGGIVASTIYTDDKGAIKFSPVEPTQNDINDFINGLYHNGQFMLTHTNFNPEYIGLLLVDTKRMVMNMTHIPTEYEQRLEKYLISQLGSLIHRFYPMLKMGNKGLPKKAVQGKGQNSISRQEAELEKQIKQFKGTAELIDAIVVATFSFVNKKLPKPVTADLGNNKAEIYVKSNNKFWKIAIEQGIEKRSCTIEQLAVEDDTASTMYSFNDQDARLKQLELSPQDDTEAIDYSDPMAVATALQQFAQPVVHGRIKRYEWQKGVAILDEEAKDKVLLMVCERDQRLYMANCHCGQKH